MLRLADSEMRVACGAVFVIGETSYIEHYGGSCHEDLYDSFSAPC